MDVFKAIKIKSYIKLRSIEKAQNFKSKNK
ncbi:hypothetical protein FWK35_00039025 [Aphis craccivora]|uniref:Uncharacterized protein n=1 Tax=Aphis craccivora TaxID=307492 RepID=A0A6G0Y9V9_APHCR|nr:hypothetical protein FWK35_00039025 [Aphis craccivora]